jgi:hypothetical protein
MIFPRTSVADPDPGSCVFLPLDPGAEIKDKKTDPGSGIREEHPGSYF